MPLLTYSRTSLPRLCAQIFTEGASFEQWEVRLGPIARRYVLSAYFLIDVGCIVPSIFDIAAISSSSPSDSVSGQLVDGGASAGVGDDGGAGGGNSSSAIKSLRVLRVLRLMRLLRLVKASTVFGRLAERVDWPLQVLRLLKLFVAAMLVLHAFACILGIFTTFAAGPSDCWLAKWGYCAPRATAARLHGDGLLELRSFLEIVFPLGADSPSEPSLTVLAEDGRAWVCVEPVDLYVTCLFWGFNLLTGGTDYPPGGPFLTYGQDVAQATHSTVLTVSEMQMMLLLKIAGAFIWSYIFGELVVALSHGVDPSQAAYDQSVDNLNALCRQTKVPQVLAQELRRYLHETREDQTHRMHMETISSLPPRLVSKISFALQLEGIMRIPCFAAVSEFGVNRGEDGARQVKQFMQDAVLAMRSNVFVPQDRPPPPKLYLIVKCVDPILIRALPHPLMALALFAPLTYFSTRTRASCSSATPALGSRSLLQGARQVHRQLRL